MQPILEKGESLEERMEASLAVMQIAMRVQGVYTVMAEAAGVRMGALMPDTDGPSPKMHIV